MKKFTLTQIQEGKDLYLYPNADLCREFTAFPSPPNYHHVDDPRLEPDEDHSYVTWNGVAVAFDLYEVPNHDNESGDINYVQIFARAKSHEIAQHADGIFKIICSPDGTCTDEFDSDDIDLTTNYATYSNIWTTNPSSLTNWAWSDIDLLGIGQKCNSPTIAGATHTLTLRPNAAGTRTQCTPNGAATNWECVDESVADEDTTYNSDNTAAGKYDSLNIENPPGGLGTITKVTVYIKGKRVGGTDATSGMAIYIRTGGVYYSDFGTNLTTRYINHSYTWTTNPGGGNWAWVDITNLEIGYQIYSFTGEARLTQCYAIVEYTEDTNPYIRVTQCYAKINYDADDKECWLSNPKSISKDHARNVKKLNFWDGTREVYDLNRNSKSVVMEGTERINDWCDEDFDYRKKIYINYQEVDDNLTNFPVLINITDSDISNHAESSSGYDIAFYDANCKLLYHDLESYTTDGHLTAWVLVPYVNSQRDTLVQMYYGNSNITNSQSSCHTWDDYAYVFHMDDHPDTSHISDSTCDYYEGVKTGANEPIEDSDGKILECQNFDGINDVVYVTDPECEYLCPLCFPICFPACFGEPPNPYYNFTITLWASHTTDALMGSGMILDKSSAVTNRHYQIYWENDDDIYFKVRDTADRFAGFERFAGTYDNQWVHILAIVNEDTARIYVNGELGGRADSIVTDLQTNDAPLRIGESGFNRFNGKLDEIRLRCEAVPNPSAWANAEYRNQNSLVSFLDIQEEEDITTPCLRIQCVKDLGKNGDDVVIADLGFTEFNNTYKIRSFGWKEVSHQPSVFDWILDLERSD